MHVSVIAKSDRPAARHPIRVRSEHEYPTIQSADIDAALAYAAELAREGTFELPLELSA